jgi:phage replication-related protein YjqB (UPF0714/DUF867 family)
MAEVKAKLRKHTIHQNQIVVLLRFKILSRLLAKSLLTALLAAGVMTVFVIIIFSTPSAAFAASFNAKVTATDRPSEVRDREHCSLGSDQLAAIGRDVGQQVRIVRDRDNYAIYTVKKQESQDGNIVRLTPKGLKKLGVRTGPIEAIVESKVPDESCLNNAPCISDTQAKRMNEFIERLDDDGTNTSLVIIAPHGGAIEVHSDTVAEKTRRHLSSLGKTVSYWRCKGWKEGGGAYERWHITSTDINEASFPLLNTILKRPFKYAISFHGFDKSERAASKQYVDIWIGGLANRSLKDELRDLIKSATGLTVKVSGELGEDDPFSATSESNIVNRLVKNSNGIQIEMAEKVRSNSTHRDKIAEAVKIFYETKI